MAILLSASALCCATAALERVGVSKVGPQLKKYVTPSAPQTCSSFVTIPLLTGLHTTRLVGSRLGRAFLSLHYYLGVQPRSS